MRQMSLWPSDEVEGATTVRVAAERPTPPVGGPVIRIVADAH